MKTTKFKDVFEFQAKSHIKAGNGLSDGNYNFYICSDTQVKKYNQYQFDKPALIFGTGGKPSVHFCDNPFAVSTDCVVAYKINDYVMEKYFYYWFRQLNLRILELGFRGTGLKHISKKYIQELEVPLLSLPEQNRIVEKLDELFSELDNGIETLLKTKAQLKVYRQAVLKDAFEGIDKFVVLGDISISRLGKMLDKQKNKGELKPYLRNINVRWLSFNLEDLLEMKIEEDEYEKFSIKANDLVICEGGEPGRCAIWKYEDTIFYQKALHRVRFKDKCEPKLYMYYFWFLAQSGGLEKYFTGTGIKHLTGESLKKVLVPKCSIDRQQQIVQEIESRLSICDQIEKTVDESLRQAESLRQSVLKQAFEGRLV